MSIGSFLVTSIVLALTIFGSIAQADYLAFPLEGTWYRDRIRCHHPDGTHTDEKQTDLMVLTLTKNAWHQELYGGTADGRHSYIVKGDFIVLDMIIEKEVTAGKWGTWRGKSHVAPTYTFSFESGELVEFPEGRTCDNGGKIEWVYSNPATS